MNFIEQALHDKPQLSPDDFLQRMAAIYEEPSLWNELHHYPSYVQDILYIIDYDTELQMEGLWSFVHASPEKQKQIITALQNCGASSEAKILLTLHNANNQTDEMITELESQLSLYNDYNGFWDIVRRYIASF